ncbi:hypothetical protein EKK58_10600 [Candidatus Dependentiae bacterium]|nr:MAG: hypothetical protein EKK58_10600 [Candidatus Dependentiae bacterium]
MTEAAKEQIAVNTAKATKPGIVTSEFWVMIITQIFIILGVSVLESLGVQVTLEQIAAVVVTAVSYITGRTINKGQILASLPKKVEPVVVPTEENKTNA